MAEEKTEKKEKPKKKRGFLFRFIKFCFFCGVFLAIVGVSTTIGVYLHFSRDLPSVSSLKNYRPPTVTTVYSDDGRKIAEFFIQRRYVIGLDEMPQNLINAFVAAEDNRFFEHQGLDFMGIARAMVKNIQAKSIRQGGSTITQQVTKSFLLSPERTFSRKIQEAILAYRIDKAFSKDYILYLYLNQIYLGHGAYGVEAAAQNYFGKPAKDMNLAECAILAGLPKAPGRDSPIQHPERARQRQIYVLNRMLDDGFITNVEVTEALNTELDIKRRKNLYAEKVPWYTEHVRRYLEKKYGRQALYESGLEVHTAVNIEMQLAARQALKTGLQDLDKRQGFRGPLDRLELEKIENFCQTLQKELDEDPPEPGDTVKAVVVDVDDDKKIATVRIGNKQGVLTLKNMKWAREPDPELAYYEDRIRAPGEALAPGDVILVKILENGEGEAFQVALEQTPAIQGSIVCLESGTSQVKAMIGGYDFSTSQFNRAFQALRQPGSAFKPIIYSAALDWPGGPFTPASILIDSPVVFKDAETEFRWKPKNYKKKFFGPTLLREALAHSRNVVTIKLMMDMGMGFVTQYAHDMGIKSPITQDLSMALGSSELTLMELVTAYSVFANQGMLLEPCFVTKVTDPFGRVLEKCSTAGRQVIEANTAFVMTHLLQGVVENGTGWRVKALKRPVAGKTGTTNNLNDAWFMGYTPRYVTGVWVGFDGEKVMGKGETGSRAASPIWLDYMEKILDGKPVRAFDVPEGVVFAKIDAETGLLAIPESKKTLFESFKQGTAPTEFTPRPEEKKVDTEQIMKFEM